MEFPSGTHEPIVCAIKIYFRGALLYYNEMILAELAEAPCSEETQNLFLGDALDRKDTWGATTMTLGCPRKPILSTSKTLMTWERVG